MGIIRIKSKSGRYIVYPKDRSEIIASGENQKEAVSNPKKMIKAIDNEKK